MKHSEKIFGTSFLQSIKPSVNPGGEKDWLQFPMGAAALAVLFLSTGFREALVSGILVIATAVFTLVVKDLLKPALPRWSLVLCVLEAAGVFTSCAFSLTWTYLQMEGSPQPWILGGLVGLLAGGHALVEPEDGSYGEVLWEGAFTWGWWILLGILREFLGDGRIFGYSLGTFQFVSKGFGLTGFGFLAAGLCLAFTCGIVKKNLSKEQSFLVILPAIVLNPPVRILTLGEMGGLAAGILIGLIFWWSLVKKLQYSRSGPAFRGLPCELLAMGFVYLILGLY